MLISNLTAASMARIPPNKDHPLYADWMTASTRFLNAAKKVERLAGDTPAARAEVEGAKKAYDSILTLIAASTLGR